MDDFSSAGDGLAEPASHKAVLSLANHLLSEFNIPAKVSRVEDINAALFVVLYERLFSDKLPGIIRQPMSREDEIHNCQIVIDVLSTDIVRDSLTHIHATNVVAGDITAISNLLDIFSYLLEYVMYRIESDVPTDNDETRSLILSEPDDGAAPVKAPSMSSVVSRDLEKKGSNKRAVSKPENRGLGTNSRINRGSTVSHKSPTRGSAVSHKPSTKSGTHRAKSVPPGTVGLNTNENRKVIRHEDFCAMTEGRGNNQNHITRAAERAPSPIRPDDSRSLLGQKTIDSECSVEDSWRKQTSTAPRPRSPKVAWEAKHREEADTREHFPKGDEARTASDVAVSTAAASVAAGSNPLSSNAFSSSLPAPHKVPEYESSKPLRSTVGPIPYQSNLTPERTVTSDRQSRRDVPVKGFSSSLDDLRSLVEKTAAMTRFALETSPIRARAERDLDITDPYLDRPRPRIPGEGARLAKELNAARMGTLETDNKFSTRPEKRVAFVTSDEESRTDEDSVRTPLSAVHINRRVPSTKTGDLDDNADSDELYRDVDYRRRINNKDLAYGDTYFEVPKPERKKKSGVSKDKAPSLATHLARNRQPELGAAHMTLKTEDRAMQRKQEILRRMYDEDLEEFSEEVKYMLDKDSKKTKETEEQVKKSCKQTGPKKKVTKKTKGMIIPSSCKKPRISAPRLKVKKGTVPADGPLKLESEEDLLPLLLDEFPHLHLSEHTWHELWRRGLHQIEAITRAYNTSKRKKSQAQNQLEDAAERHELLGDIMKKQLDHQKRLRDIKDQKQMAVQLRNKTHEKRQQSARARKYYNEYQVRSRGKQLKRRTKEEMVFKDLFKDALDIQKERVKDIRQYASDQRSRQESRRQNEIDSMENYYRDQFDLLSEKLTQERQETEVRDSAQQKMLQQMKREIRKKMESEIKLYQEQLFQDDDDAHWRQMDADRIKQQLHMARYSAQI